AQWLWALARGAPARAQRSLVERAARRASQRAAALPSPMVTARACEPQELAERHRAIARPRHRLRAERVPRRQPPDLEPVVWWAPAVAAQTCGPSLWERPWGFPWERPSKRPWERLPVALSVERAAKPGRRGRLSFPRQARS